MSDKPLVLTRQNVCAVRERRKFQTRRIINPQPVWKERDGLRAAGWSWSNKKSGYSSYQTEAFKKVMVENGRFQVGDRAYVAEGYQIDSELGNGFVLGRYLADNKEFEIQLPEREWDLWAKRKFPYRKTPGRFMYKSLARIFLPIVEVRIERLQDISGPDIYAEGCPPKCASYNMWFSNLWNSIHGKGAWDLNPWVFCYRWDEIIIKGE